MKTKTMPTKVPAPVPTETDIREAAKALTGWTADYVDTVGLTNFRFVASRHDTTNKTIFGRTGNWSWQDVCQLCLENPYHASFFVTKLWSYFVPVPPDEATQATLQRDNANLASALKQVDLLKAEIVQAGAAEARAQAVQDQAELNLGYTTITAPIDGVVGNRSLRVGQYVQAGTQLMSVVPIAGAYIVANYKETQLTDVHEGQAVDIEVDMFPGKVVHGHVDSIAPASGQEFALLPPDNATGNFTKVVQRIPVKIALDAGNNPAVELRPGMSVIPTIETRSSSTRVAASSVKAPKTISGASKAFSSEVGTGSREENASKQTIAFSSEVGTGSLEENASKLEAAEGARRHAPGVSRPGMMPAFGLKARQIMAAQIRIVATPRQAAIGRSKKNSSEPSALIIDVMKFCSSISPSTRPRIAGAIGKPFSSISQPTMPMTSMMIMPKVELVMA